MLIEVHRKIQQVPVLQTGVVAGYRWSVEFSSRKDRSYINVRVYVPRLLRRLEQAYQYPLSPTEIQYELPPRYDVGRVNDVYVLDQAIRADRTPTVGWVEIEYASRRIMTSPQFATVENSMWRVASGCWPTPVNGWSVLTDWASACANMQPAAEHICRELRKVEEKLCSS